MPAMFNNVAAASAYGQWAPWRTGSSRRFPTRQKRFETFACNTTGPVTLLVYRPVQLRPEPSARLNHVASERHHALDSDSWAQPPVT
jgi:hypothetical protein